MYTVFKHTHPGTYMGLLTFGFMGKRQNKPHQTWTTKTAFLQHARKGLNGATSSNSPLNPWGTNFFLSAMSGRRPVSGWLNLHLCQWQLVKLCDDCLLPIPGNFGRNMQNKTQTQTSHSWFGKETWRVYLFQIFPIVFPNFSYKNRPVDARWESGRKSSCVCVGKTYKQIRSLYVYKQIYIYIYTVYNIYIYIYMPYAPCPEDFPRFAPNMNHMFLKLW